MLRAPFFRRQSFDKVNLQPFLVGLHLWDLPNEWVIRCTVKGPLIDDESGPKASMEGHDRSSTTRYLIPSGQLRDNGKFP